jgi:hypothetical protein
VNAPDTTAPACDCPASLRERREHSTVCPSFDRCPVCGSRLDPVRGGCLPCFIAQHARGARISEVHS